MCPPKRRNNLKKGIKRLFNLLEFIIFVFLIYYLFFINVDIKKARFPIKYEETVTKYSEEYELDPLMIYSIIKVESSFDENAESNKGARGLMQITPSTGEWIAEKLKIEEFHSDDLFIPEINIMMGTWYFNYLAEKFDNDISLVIAAYNAGPGKVQNWLKDKETSENGQDLNNIPYKETENYIKKFDNTYEQYKELYK
jgi:soluble lytic murein transglycosylase